MGALDTADPSPFGERVPFTEIDSSGLTDEPYAKELQDLLDNGHELWVTDLVRSMSESGGWNHLEEFAKTSSLGNRDSLAIHTAMGLATTLRGHRNPPDTGHEPQVLGVRQHTFENQLIVALLTHPQLRDYDLIWGDLVAELSPEAGSSEAKQKLFDYMVQNNSRDATEVHFVDLTRDEAAGEPKDDGSKLLRGLEKFLDRILSNRPLKQEGGDISCFEPEIYRNFLDPAYIWMRFRELQLHGSAAESGLNGQTLIRLKIEGKALGVEGALDSIPSN